MSRSPRDGLRTLTWETIALVVEKPENLSSRAINASRVFDDIVTHLGEMARPGPNLIPLRLFRTLCVRQFWRQVMNILRTERTDEAEGRLENLQELVNAAVDYDEQGVEGLREFIDHSALVSDQDQYKRDAPVTLMTVHSAKGLEFPLVFIVGLEDGLFPHSRSATDPAEFEEERRLSYVAMTRAEDIYTSRMR